VDGWLVVRAADLGSGENQIVRRLLGFGWCARLGD
jgi:hypothetical protein